MRIAIIGGGSAYMPGLIRGFLAARDELAGSTLALTDINPENLELQATLARKMIHAAGADYRVEATTDRRAAIAGAAFILTTFRPGGFEARRLDERIPLKYGVIGQETIGPGGLFLAFRAIPVVLDVVREARELAPDAWIMNYTNPTQMVTRAVLRAGWNRVVGLCDQHGSDLAEIARWLGIEPEKLRARWYGLNHATWITRLELDGEDVLPQLHRRVLDLPDDALPEGRMRYAFRLFRLYGLIPNSYLRYYYFHDELVRQAQAAPMTRAEEIMARLPAILENYRREARKPAPDPTRERGAGDHGEYAVEVIAAVANDCHRELIVNVPNAGAITDFGPDAVVEVPAVLGREGARPLPMGPLPTAVAGLLHALQAYDELAVEAAMTGSRQKALQAMLANPLIHSHELAERLLDELMEAHKAHLPQFSPAESVRSTQYVVRNSPYLVLCTASPLDVVCYGTCFADLLFTGLPDLPRLGTEIYATGLGLAPGGVANVAMALSRLGLRVGLISALGDDPFGDFIWDTLAREGIDLSAVKRCPGARTAVTVSLSYPKDRAMVTYGEHLRAEFPPPDSDYWAGVRGFFYYVSPGVDGRMVALHERGIALFADTSWDPSQAWHPETLESLPYLAAFLPNEPEALAYSRTSTVDQALEELARTTATAVIKRGADGAVARQGDEVVQVPGLSVPTLDTTGAGDVFNAGYIYGALAGWPLRQRVALGCLCAGISVTRHSGSLAAPTWDELEAFVARLPPDERQRWQPIVERR